MDEAREGGDGKGGEQLSWGAKKKVKTVEERKKRT